MEQMGKQTRKQAEGFTESRCQMVHKGPGEQRPWVPVPDRWGHGRLLAEMPPEWNSEGEDLVIRAEKKRKGKRRGLCSEAWRPSLSCLGSREGPAQRLL